MVITRSQTARAAAMQVFETAELMEMILLEVGEMKTILVSQRTHPTFRDTIKGSIKLQRALWMQPQEERATDMVNPFFLNATSMTSRYRLVNSRRPFYLDTRQDCTSIFRFVFNADMLKLEYGSWRDMCVLGHQAYPQVFYEYRCASEARTWPTAIWIDTTWTAGDVVDEIKKRAQEGNWDWGYNSWPDWK